MKFGLVCKFEDEPIKFRMYTYKHINKLISNGEEDLARKKILDVWENNVSSLQEAINYCSENSIESYRVPSDIFPQSTRMIELGIVDQDDLDSFAVKLRKIDSKNIVLSMHPGQHVNMGSPRESVVESSVQDLKEHFFVAKNIKVEEINIHAGGVYGDKDSAKDRFVNNMKEYLYDSELSKITLENDELSYNIEDILELSERLNIRTTFDIHHHRAHQLKQELPLSEKEYFLLARKTWKHYGYQRLHLSSPRVGYKTAAKSRPHSEYIQIEHVPEWIHYYKEVYVDIEAKKKEKAIFKLRDEVSKNN